MTICYYYSNKKYIIRFFLIVACRIKNNSKSKICLSAITLSFFVMFYVFYTPISVYASYVNDQGITGTFEIDNDNTSTPTNATTLNMAISGATEMRFWNTTAQRDAASWQSYANSLPWTLSNGWGKKTVYGEFRNASGDIVSVSDDIISDDITLPYTSGLTLWLDAADSSTITQSAGNISQWSDKSGNNYHTKQTAGASQPKTLTNEIDFDGTNDYLYIENLHYVNTNPLDGFLVCTVFRTPNTKTGLSDNWAFLDFDRSEWFDFYNLGADIGMSYDSNGTIRDVRTVAAGINDNNLHISCGSYDNTIATDTVITVDGTTSYSNDLEPIGAQVGVWQATRYGFVWDGSEATTQNGGKNGRYYEGGISEIVYFDVPVNATNRKEVECYLWEKWGITVPGCPDIVPPIASVSYSPDTFTTGNVVATLTNESESITVTNNGGSRDFTFTSNGSFTFEFEDASGNTGTVTATVDWIADPVAPSSVGTASYNSSPVITSHGGAGVVDIIVSWGSTDVTTVTATDETHNIIWQYAKTTLTGNVWQPVEHAELCSPVVVASHRQLVNGQIQRAPRVRNKSANDFQVRVDNYNSNIGTISTDIDYIVMSAGAYNFWWGLLVESGTKATSAVACATNSVPTPDVVNFLSSFSTAPAVLHTISTENDSSWVVSGVNGDNGNRGSEPTTTKMGTILQRSFNSCTHASEDLDYMAFAPGHYTLADSSILDVKTTLNNVWSYNATWYAVPFTSSFSTPPQTIVVSQMWEDGWNGAYAQVHTWWAITTTQFSATMDEDGPLADRSHANESVAAVSFNNASGDFLETNILTYSLSWGADISDFTIDASTGKLDFLVAQNSSSYNDANADWIYEVEVSVCDSHCNSKCSTQTIRADVSDSTPPTITSFSPANDDVLPGGNHSITLAYNDLESGIDTSSADIELYRWDGTTWGTDIAWTGITTNSVTNSVATYQTNNLGYGKYKFIFEISDNSWNSVIQEWVFYIDRPLFSVSTSEIDIGIVHNTSTSFSPNVDITVKTVGVPYDVVLYENTDPTNSTENIQSYDGTNGYGYDTWWSGNITQIGTSSIIHSQGVNINTNGGLNTQVHSFNLWAIVEDLKIAWDYEWYINIWVIYHY